MRELNQDEKASRLYAAGWWFCVGGTWLAPCPRLGPFRTTDTAFSVMTRLQRPRMMRPAVRR